MEILLSKCRVKKILVMSFSKPSLFSSDVDKFKLETKIKTLKSIVDENKLESIKVISLLNASRKLLVSEVLRLVKLILLVPTTNAASKRSRSTLCRVKTYLRISMTQEHLTSCLIVTTYKFIKGK